MRFDDGNIIKRYYDGEGEFNYATKDIQYKCVVEVRDTLDILLKYVISSYIYKMDLFIFFKNNYMGDIPRFSR